MLKFFEESDVKTNSGHLKCKTTSRIIVTLNIPLKTVNKRRHKYLDLGDAILSRLTEDFLFCGEYKRGFDIF